MNSWMFLIRFLSLSPFNSSKIVFYFHMQTHISIRCSAGKRPHCCFSGRLTSALWTACVQRAPADSQQFAK